jgi:hypothetical protein
LSPPENRFFGTLIGDTFNGITAPASPALTSRVSIPTQWDYSLLAPNQTAG